MIDVVSCNNCSYGNAVTFAALELQIEMGDWKSSYQIPEILNARKELCFLPNLSSG